MKITKDGFLYSVIFPQASARHIIFFFKLEISYLFTRNSVVVLERNLETLNSDKSRLGQYFATALAITSLILGLLFINSDSCPCYSLFNETEILNLKI